MMPAHALPPARAIARMPALRDSRDGGVAVTFGLLLLPTLVAVGIGVDVARAYTAKMKFEAAFDNAAMALRASAATEPAAALQARMQSFLDLANPSPAPGEHVALRMSDPLKPVVIMAASTAVPTTMLQLAGVKSLPLHAAAQVVRQNPPGSAGREGGDDGAAREEELRRRLQYDVRHGLWLREDWHR